MSQLAGPIARQSLHDAVTARLRDMIVEGEYPPGSRLPERVLCETFGISRTPLREALKVLASEGLLELAPNRGARVAGLTADDVDELFPVMGALEALAGELACARITDTELAEIRALHYQMVLHHKRGERPPYFDLNQQIHEKILEAARNLTLTASYTNLSGRIRRARRPLLRLVVAIVLIERGGEVPRDRPPRRGGSQARGEVEADRHAVLSLAHELVLPLQLIRRVS